jgi:hypothetical protein
VERDARALGDDEFAGVDGGLAREHPQQRGLAAAVASGQGHAVSLLELERDAPQKRFPGNVLAEVGCDHNGHGR